MSGFSECGVVIFTFSEIKYLLPTPRKAKYVTANLFIITYLGAGGWDIQGKSVDMNI